MAASGVVVAPLPARPEFVTARSRDARARCAEVSYPARLAVAEHVHARASITIVVDGALIEAQGVARARCGRGTAIVRHAGEPHRNVMEDGGARFLDLALDEELAARCELARVERSVVCHPGIAALAGRMRAELRVDDRAQPLVIEGLALEIAGCLLREGRGADGQRRAPGWLVRARQRLEEEGEVGVTIGELAEEAGVHPASLARAFRRFYRLSPGAFVRARRVAEAAERLVAERGVTIAEVAVGAGFYDQSHFARVFRAQMGVSPGDYRRGRGA